MALSMYVIRKQRTEKFTAEYQNDREELMTMINILVNYSSFTDIIAILHFEGGKLVDHLKPNGSL